MSKPGRSTPSRLVGNGFEICYRSWLRGQTCRQDLVGHVARIYATHREDDPVDCLYDEAARQEYWDVFNSDKRPDDETESEENH